VYVDFLANDALAGAFLKRGKKTKSSSYHVHAWSYI